MISAQSKRTLTMAFLLLLALVVACGGPLSPAPATFSVYPTVTQASFATPVPTAHPIPTEPTGASPFVTVSHIPVLPTITSQPASPTLTSSPPPFATSQASAVPLPSRTSLPTPRPDGTILLTADGGLYMVDACCVESDLGCSAGWTQLTEAPGRFAPPLVSPYALSMSPDGRYVAFTYVEWNEMGWLQHSSIHILDVQKCSSLPAGCKIDDTFQLMSDPGQYPSDPAWSPAGDVIAFALTDGRGADSGLAIIRPDGSGYRLLLRADQVAPFAILGMLAWSPNGQKLAFSATYGGERHDDTYIYTVNRDGSGLKQITDFPHQEPHPGFDDGPRWSPNGQKILFVSNHRHEGWEEEAWHSYLYTMNTDGTEITPLGIEGRYAVWSPDGRQILYLDYYGDLYVVNVADGQPKRLTSGRAYIEAAIWVP